MDELKISFPDNDILIANRENVINVSASSGDDKLIYKFIIGNDGIWNTIQDYSKQNVCVWIPKEEGKYIVMVQGKKEGSRKPFDFMSKEEIVVDNEASIKLIKNVTIEKTSLYLGEKNEITVFSNEKEVLFRFWKMGNKDWEPLVDYSLDNKYVFTATTEGQQEILIECKRLNSKEKVDEYTTVKFDVKKALKTEIKNFECLNKELLVNNELVFKVETTLDNKRTLIYKFVKIDKLGKCTCIQDYSSRRVVSYKERVYGKYKLLCLVRDLLSNKEYDDRAVLNYYVKPYDNVKITYFKPDLKSPQLKKTSIDIKVIATGGRELVYRYIVDGPIAEDSGYIRNNVYTWIPKEDGKYNITVLTKDISFNGEFEDKKTLEYIIDNEADKPVRIIDVKSNVRNKVLVGEPIKVTVQSEGGIVPLYSFILYKDKIEIERADFDVQNWVQFNTKESGEYEIEVQAKDKYSSKEYDSNVSKFYKVVKYYPANIDYLLYRSKEHYIVGDKIPIEIITQNTKEVLIKYDVFINGGKVESSEYKKGKVITLEPKCAGKYTIVIYAKNVKCVDDYDSKKEVNIYVFNALPVRNLEIYLNKEKPVISDELTFAVSSKGGRRVVYEFYIWENGNWNKVQNYSRKQYYTFIPYIKGKHKILVMAKSFYKKVNYEAYKEKEFEVF